MLSVWNTPQIFLFGKPFPKQIRVFMRLQYKSFENTQGKSVKGEIACN